MNYLISISLFFISILHLIKKDYSGALIFIVPWFFLVVSSFLTNKRLKIEKNKKERRDLFDSLVSPKVLNNEEGYSTIISFVVPSPEFFYEMTKRV